TQLNISLGATISFCIVFLFLSMSFGEALPDENSVEGAYDWWDVPLNERHNMDLPMDTMRAQLPEEGKYEIQPYTEHFITVDLPSSEQDVGYPDEAKMHVALWLPEVEEGTKVPVIMTIHPYYDFGGEGMPGIGADSNPNTIPDGGVGQWVYETFVPHGYALAQASTFGTG
ncbi:MAG: CocE/NonD family hydrolase, partial [Candidatus Poseidoniaceae archaeon]